jgi:hypothetical protein
MKERRADWIDIHVNPQRDVREACRQRAASIWTELNWRRFADGVEACQPVAADASPIDRTSARGGDDAVARTLTMARDTLLANTSWSAP